MTLFEECKIQVDNNVDANKLFKKKIIIVNFSRIIFNFVI